MSVVVAIKENGKIYLGCDSQVSSGGTRTTLKNPNNYKIWNISGLPGCFMGSVGDLRDACLIRTSDEVLTDYDLYRDRVDYSFVVNHMVPTIINLLRDAHFLPSDGPFTAMESSYLFAFRNKLYAIHRDGSVIEIDDYVAIGSGKNEAIGSLLSTEGQTPERRIIQAIKASAANDIYVDYPIILVDTEKGEFSVLSEKDVQRMDEKK